jgi:hypothetical protein
MTATARTGWWVMWRCGCARVAQTDTDLEETCPGHGAERINRPEVITDHRSDNERALLGESFYGLHPEPAEAQRAQDDTEYALCDWCIGDGQLLDVDQQWVLCSVCGGSGERQAA